MKRKIIISILTFFIISALGAVIASLHIKDSTETLNRITTLRQLEDLHRQLFFSIRAVQSDLCSPTPTMILGQNQPPADIAAMVQSTGKCTTCHHKPETTARINQIQARVLDYQNTLLSFRDAKKQARQTDKVKLRATALGDEVLGELQGLLEQVSNRLNSIIQDAKRRIAVAWLILAGTVIVLLVLSVIVAVHLVRVVTNPINTLVNATRMIASGNLGYRIDRVEKDEFGELAAHFNSMSLSLKDGYAKLEQEIAERKKSEKQHAYDAFHDALTGLPNRALFMDRLEHVLTASHRRPGAPYYAVLFLDMDRFKVINDSLGHTIGDQVLIAVGHKLADCIRPGDTVARLGGDEFAILLENITELGHTVEVAERIKKKLSIPIDIKGHEVFASVSIGITLGTERYERSEQVLRDADIAMYEAKGQGKSSYEIFDAKMHANIMDRMQLETDLRKAIDLKEFTLYYQPIMNLKTQQLTGFEALVRWNHPKRGLIYPLEFIPLAEENNLIYPIGEWILREACRELKLLQTQHPTVPPLTMSINISRKQFGREDLADKLSGYLAEFGVDPHTLALEITESMIMQNVDVAIKTMKQLRTMGVQLHIDDFGTGHSSLSYLHQFPVNALKIDRSFINRLSADGTNNEIITSIITLAKSLNCDVIAEGVEMEHQLSNIQELRCGYGQGFLFARPMAFPAIENWMQKQKRF